MKFVVLTLFPEMIRQAAGHSILRRAADEGLISVECVDIRDFSRDRHRRVDDEPYGGGAGMVMAAGPVFDACAYAKNIAGNGDGRGGPVPVVFMTPQGRRFDQKQAERLAQFNAVILLCGHYEGVDQRVLDEVVTEELSLGDFILTGGELAALAVIDSVSRLIPGVLGKRESYEDESFSDLTGGLLEYPQYTRPPEFRGASVPEVILAGNHRDIADWRRKESLRLTLEKRPDLLLKAELSRQDVKYLMKKIGDGYMRGIITVLGHDKIGIIAKVCTYLSEQGINILDISQTIIQGYFHMMMIVDIEHVTRRFEELCEELAELGKETGVEIKLQREDIFDSMHRL
ncbi:MAG: tRNA (guanosine(37)-N1)-methyltransferase TrmD [Defluviitaleaceae bacterium]|nr:tRNA (guanosine(37)-N1)-methyltransferase TrmD [Defluviitaleaceae bacterium]